MSEMWRPNDVATSDMAMPDLPIQAGMLRGRMTEEDLHLKRMNTDMDLWLILERLLCSCIDVCTCGWDDGFINTEEMQQH